MLSNPPQTSGLHSRQRQHRRQNSTPSAFEAVKIAPLPNFQQQRSSVSHRRGLSLDTRRQQLSPATPATTTLRQDYTTVSTSTTNSGLSTTPQHVLRETQQQRIARPGHGQPNGNNFAQHQLQQQNPGDDFLLSPQGTPLHPQVMDAIAAQGQLADLGGLPYDAYMGQMDAMSKKNQANFATSNAMSQGQEFEFFGPDSALSTPTFMNFPDASPAGSGQGWISEGETASTHTRRSSRRISHGILDKVAKFEAMGNSMDASAQRPTTPPGHNMNAYFPPTPTETPHDRIMKHEVGREQQQQRPNRFSDNYDESMEETIKPVRGNRSSNRNSSIFQELRQQVESDMVHTPPRSNTMPMAFAEQGLRTPDFMNMTNLNAEFVKIEHGFDGLATGRLSISSDMSSHASPLTSSMASLGGLPHNAFDYKHDLHPPVDFDSQNTVFPPHRSDSPGYMGSTSPSRHRRTDSIASIASAASIASINIEETKTDTGVTTDDIATYIEGPDPSDGKWVCLYENCQKRFGRKENIKSHVQTHLNDRQYQCPTCKKCFVRQHDLKRHAKIHTGIKPYPCQCGNSFARHDALTRHRQRGMCIGAFDGIVRKVVKRGRPRKNRPDLDERREKSDRTRRKNTSKHTSASSVSSHSAYSDSSAVNSPSNEFDNLMDDDHFPDMMDVALADLAPGASSPTMNPSSLTVSTAPMPTPTTTLALTDSLNVMSGGPGPAINHHHHNNNSNPTPQPEIIDLDQLDLPSNSNTTTAAAASPSALSIHSYHSPVTTTTAATSYTAPHLPSSPGAKSVTSHYTHHGPPSTPPELSASSSPPPTSSSGGGGARFFSEDNEGCCDDDDDEAGNISGISDSSIGLGTTLSAHAAASGAGGGDAEEDDLLLQFGDDVGLLPVGYHHGGSIGQMMMMGGMGGMDGSGSSGGGKYGGSHGATGMIMGGVDVVTEAEYDAAVNMSLFTDGDVYFGA